MGDMPENHYGHRNVIFAGTGDNEIPARPIASRAPASMGAEYGQLPRIIRALNLLVAKNRHALDVSRYFEQLPGCPQYSRHGLGAERLADLCRNECYNPSEQRKLIERLEVVKITPQVSRGEPVETLIEDPWLVHECPPDPLGCSLTFSDPDYASVGRDAVYYVRAIQAESEAVNGANLRCEYDSSGQCIAVDPCHANEALTDYEDDCLATIKERAWSSPIFVDYQ